MTPQEKSDRLLEAACAILNAAPNQRLNLVVLNKALFYLDLYSLRDRGRLVTHNAYIGIQQGPVIAKYPQRLVGGLESRGLAKQLSCWDGSKPIQLESALQHFTYLDSEAQSQAATVASHFSTISSSQASDFSHENPGWQLAWNEFLRTGKPTAVDMHIALQQIMEDDPWMDVPLQNDAEILAAADNGVGEDW